MEFSQLKADFYTNGGQFSQKLRCNETNCKMCINVIPVFKAPGARTPTVGSKRTNRKNLFRNNFPVIISRAEFIHNHQRTKESHLVAVKKSGSEMKFMNPSTLKALLLSLYRRSPSMPTQSMRSILEVCTPNSIIWNYHKIRNLKLKNRHYPSYHD